MDTKGRLIAGSHNRNEFVLINADEISRVTSVKELSGQSCQICGDEIEITVDGEPFVACNECAFPVCRPCYEYERREGNQACPQCKTRYKRIKGSPRVEGDEEEDDIDDLENELQIASNDPNHIAEAMLAARLNVGRGSHANGSVYAPSEMDASSVAGEIPLLTYGQEDVGISADKHALIVPPLRGKRVHPMPFSDSMSFQPRPMDPKKDLAVYGYGSITWKDRMEEWRKKQNERLQVVKHQGENGGGINDGDELDDPELPKMDEGRQPLSRKLPIPSSKISPYRLIILLRIVIVCLFFHYRILHPVNDAYPLWLTSIICEIWFAVSWILDQFPKWHPIVRETYLDRLSLRYEKEGKPSAKSPPLIVLRDDQQSKTKTWKFGIFVRKISSFITMAEAVLFNIIGRILGKLGSGAIQEMGSIWGVKDELRKLQKSMSAIKAVILDAEEKRFSNHQVRDWLQKLEDVVYEADDLVDELNTEALRRKVMSRNNQMAKKVRVFFSSSNQLAFRVKMAKKIKVIGEILDEIRANRSFYLMENMEEKTVSHSGRETHSFAREEEVIGRDEDKVEILKLLLDLGFEENVSIISIVGMGGLGKTTLAQLVFNDEMVQKHFELKIWVCVSDVFDFKLIIEKIIKSAMNNCPNNLDNLEMDQLQNQLREELEGKRYLLVLDDVWNEDRVKWLNLNSLLMGGAGGSKVLVTTRSEKVVKITHAQPYYLMGLDKDKSWSLFKRMALEQGQEPQNPSIIEMGMEIVEKCGGVPLAIRAIGSTLYLKNPETEWLSFKNNELAKTSELESDVLQALELSYKHLPSHLKHCFGYCALFPKDFHIDVQMLIKLWMAQGFIKSMHQNQCLEDVGYGYFMDLLWRSFFQEAKKDDWGAIRSCKMHDLMHDLAIRVAGTSSCRLNESMENFYESTRHVSFDFELSKPLRIPASSIEKSKIRTFLLPKQRYEERLNVPNFDELWSNFKFLRMLDLNSLHIKILPNSLGKLKHLRYLNLSYNKIELLPSSITRLQNLQTLILSGCKKLLSLPIDMNKLISLRHLEMYECWSLTHMPRGLGELTALQTLDQFVVVENSIVVRDSGGLGELSLLNNLRGELSIKNLGHGKCTALKSKDANLKEKQHLHSLRLVWKNEDCGYTSDILEGDEISLDGLQPHSNLKSLKVEYFMGQRVAGWLSLLTNLVKLYLIGCKNCLHLPPLDRLPSLKELKLLSLTSLQYVSDRDGAVSTHGELFPSSPCLATPFFPSLVKLEIRDCPNLWAWWRDIDDLDEDFESMIEYQNITSFPCLSYLTIESCPDLTFLPLFPHLESLSLTNTSSKPFLRTMMMMNDSTEAAATSTPAMSISTSVSPSPATSSSSSPLSKLKYLVISNIEDIEHLPQEICNLSSLELIHLSKCPNLASLPDEICSLSSVWIFQIGQCPKLTRWPSSYQPGLA